MKKDSADGRLLIWKCSLSMMKENWIAGYGAGGFETHYMNYQADYLRSHPDSLYNQLADTVQYPFCEYLNISINYGITGLLIVGVLVYTLICSYRKDPSQNKKTVLLAVCSRIYSLLLPINVLICLGNTFIQHLYIAQRQYTKTAAAYTHSSKESRCSYFRMPICRVSSFTFLKNELKTPVSL